MQRTELALPDGKGFAEACDRFVGHILLEVVDADQEVSVARFQAVLVVKLLNQLNVLDVAQLAFLLVANRVVEGGYYAVSLQHPLVVIEGERLLESMPLGHSTLRRMVILNVLLLGSLLLDVG